MPAHAESIDHPLGRLKARPSSGDARIRQGPPLGGSTRTRVLVWARVRECPLSVELPVEVERAVALAAFLRPGGRYDRCRLSSAERQEHSLEIDCRMMGRSGLFQAGRGHIKVSPGVVECEFPARLGIPTGTRPVVHRAPEITVFQARVPVYLMRTTVRLIGEDGRVFYAWPSGQLRRLLDALKAAGFTVRYRKTWLIAMAQPWSAAK